MKRLTAVFLFLIVWTPITLLWAAPVPDTGQCKCYNYSGEIPCPSPGQDFYGQDANYTINPPSYTKLDNNCNALKDSATSWAMVRDNVTGLIWEVNTSKYGVKKYTWYDSNPMTNRGGAGAKGDVTGTENYIKELNVASYGRYCDWRLPTITELAYIVDRNPGTTIYSTFFPNTGASWYWSSTTNAYDTDTAYLMNFYYGYDNARYKNYYAYVRAVRGGQSGTFENSVIGSFDIVKNDTIQNTMPAGRFTVNGDGTVTDSSTGLMWQQRTPDNIMNWKGALDYCNSSSISLHRDWRLPNTNELRSLIDHKRYNPAIDILYFPNTAASDYWSSTTTARGTNAWTVDFYCGFGMDSDKGGNVSNNGKSDSFYVRAVRGGQNWLLGHLFISTPAQAAFLAVGANMEILWQPQKITDNVAITLSRDGGKTWETIIASTPNDGSHPWIVSSPQSVNCMLKIEPVNDRTKGTVQGLFTVYVR